MREHLCAGLDYQAKLARFLENHDEPRAAATFPPGMHEAAAVVTYLSPGLRFFHQGQFEGRKDAHLATPGPGTRGARGRAAPAFYDALLAVLRQPAVRDGDWSLLECVPAWDGNGTWDGFIARWRGQRRPAAPRRRQLLPEPGPVLRPRAVRGAARASVRLRDRMCAAIYDRSGDDLAARGLYLDLPGWGYHVFEVSPAS